MSLASRGAKPRDPPGPLSLDSTGGKPTASRPPFLPSHLAQIGCCEPPQNDFKIYGHFSPRKLDTQFWQFFQTRWYLVTDPLAPSWIYWAVLVRAVEGIPDFAWSYVRESPTAFLTMQGPADHPQSDVASTRSRRWIQSATHRASTVHSIQRSPVGSPWHFYSICLQPKSSPNDTSPH